MSALDEPAIAALEEAFVKHPAAFAKALEELSAIFRPPPKLAEGLQGAGPGNAPGRPGL